MKGPDERLKDFASIDGLLRTKSPGTMVVAEATWAMADLSAGDLAGHYSESDLLKLIDQLTSTDQRCHQSHIDKLNEAIQFKRGEKEGPRQLVAQLLKEERIPYIDQQVTVILSELRQAFQSNEGVYDLDQWYQIFRSKIVSIYNALELVRLYEAIKNAVGEDNAKTIFSSWDLIGEDIKSNQRAFTPQDYDQALTKAIAKFNKKNIEMSMQRVKKELRSGELPANPAVVQKSLGKFWRMLDPEQKNQVDVLVKKELVIKQLKRRILYQVPPLEEVVYLMLRKGTRTLKDTRVIDENIAVFLHRFLAEENIQGITFDLLQERIRVTKMEIRYLSVGGSQENATLVRVLTDALTDRLEELGQSWSRLLKADMARMFASQEVLEKFPMLKEFLVMGCADLLKENPRKFLVAFMKKQKKELREFVDPTKYTEESCAVAIEHFLESNLTADAITLGYNQMFTVFMEISGSAFLFYGKYQNSIRVELIQGLRDGQEVLNQGVCLGVSARIGSLLQENPLLLLAQLSEEFQIRPEDRFHQASYLAQSNVDKRRRLQTLFPEGIASKEHGYGNYDNRSFFRSTEHFISSFDAVVESVQSTAGVCMLNFNMREGGGHSTILVIDRVNGRYGIIDCNIGIIDFSSQKNDPESATLAVLECAKDLLQFYGEMKGIEIRQNPPKNEKTADQSQAPNF